LYNIQISPEAILDEIKNNITSQNKQLKADDEQLVAKSDKSSLSTVSVAENTEQKEVEKQKTIRRRRM